MLLEDKNPRGKWTRNDHLLAAALVLIDSEVSPSGWPKHIVDSDRVGFVVDRFEDGAEEALTRYRKVHEKALEGKDHIHLFPRPVLNDEDAGWPTREEYREIEKERKGE